MLSTILKCQDVQHTKGKREEERRGDRKGQVCRGEDVQGQVEGEAWRRDVDTELTESSCVAHQGVQPLVDDSEHIQLHRAADGWKKGEGTVKKKHTLTHTLRIVSL